MRKDYLKQNHGFTLLEVMIVVLIIGILVSVALLNFMRPANNSRAKSCISTLKEINSAKEQWALENQKQGSETPTWSDLKGPGRYIKSNNSNGMICRMGGLYTIGSVDTLPTCSLGNTVDPPHVFPETLKK